MVASHIFYYFTPDITWLRIPDRISVPVFLVAIGYNAGQRLPKTIYIGALLIWLMNIAAFNSYFVDFLGTIILVRFLIDPMATAMLKNKSTFWAINVLLILLYPISNVFFDYGTLAFIMALAGWLGKNGKILAEHIIKPYEYFIFATLLYLLCMKIAFGFSSIEIGIIAAGLSVTMYLLYNMKTLLMNSIRNKPTDAIGRFCKFLGHKSLEIYIVHILLFQSIVYYITHIQ